MITLSCVNTSFCFIMFSHFGVWPISVFVIISMMTIIYILNDLKFKLQYNIIEATCSERRHGFKCTCYCDRVLFSFHLSVKFNILFSLTLPPLILNLRCSFLISLSASQWKIETPWGWWYYNFPDSWACNSDKSSTGSLPPS